MAEEFLSYKGKPLVRSKNTIYYGDMSDSCVVMMQILKTEKGVEDLDMATRVSIQLISTDITKNPLERIMKKGEKIGLYDALDLASIWLERELSTEAK